MFSLDPLLTIIVKITALIRFYIVYSNENSSQMYQFASNELNYIRRKQKSWILPKYLNWSFSRLNIFPTWNIVVCRGATVKCEHVLGRQRVEPVALPIRFPLFVVPALNHSLYSPGVNIVVFCWSVYPSLAPTAPPPWLLCMPHVWQHPTLPMR